MKQLQVVPFWPLELGRGRAFFDRCRAELDARGRRYAVVRGDWEERFRAAVEAVGKLL